MGEIYDLTQVPIIKAVNIKEQEDIFMAQQYMDVADYILLDGQEAGEGKRFNWSWLNDIHWEKPWILAGGLTAHNIFNAIRLTGAHIVDVSSGVEYEKGKKDPEKIADFIYQAHVADKNR